MVENGIGFLLIKRVNFGKLSRINYEVRMGTQAWVLKTNLLTTHKMKSHSVDGVELELLTIFQGNPDLLSARRSIRAFSNCGGLKQHPMQKSFI